MADGKQNDNKGSLTNTGVAVLGVGILAVLFAAAGVTILKRRQSGDHGSLATRPDPQRSHSAE